MDSLTFDKLEYLLSGYGVTSEEINGIVDLMEEDSKIRQRELVETIKGSHKIICSLVGIDPDKIDEHSDHYEKLIKA